MTRSDRVFRAAERNAPSVVFIDDADVIFGGDKESGLYRYLLTKLDGLESAGAGRICVMMDGDGTVRSACGDSSFRAALSCGSTRGCQVSRHARTFFRDRLASVPAPLCNVDVEALASASRGCTGADLKSAVEDGKLRFAHNQVMGKPHPPLEAYFIEAITAIRGNRRKYRKRASGVVGRAADLRLPGVKRPPAVPKLGSAGGFSFLDCQTTAASQRRRLRTPATAGSSAWEQSDLAAERRHRREAEEGHCRSGSPHTACRPP